MKSFISTSLAALIAASGMMITTDADARGRHFRGRIGVYVGAPFIFSPWWYGHHPYAYGYPHYPHHPYSAPIVREEPTIYIEQNAPETSAAPAPAPQAQAQAPQQYWYYCQDSRTYYPHTQTCASPWQRVIPHAPQ